MNHPGHHLVGGQVVCASSLFPPFVHGPSGAPRNLTGGERQLLLLPFRRHYEVNKVLSALERREQYRQAVLTVERGGEASRAYDRCRSTVGERTFQGCFFTSVLAKCAECIRHGGPCVGAQSKFRNSIFLNFSNRGVGLAVVVLLLPAAAATALILPADPPTAAAPSASADGSPPMDVPAAVSSLLEAMSVQHELYRVLDELPNNDLRARALNRWRVGSAHLAQALVRLRRINFEEMAALSVVSGEEEVSDEED